MGERGQSRVEFKTAGGAGVSSGHAWRPFGLGGATWQGEGRTAEEARAVGGGWGDTWTGGAALQKLGKRPAAAVTRAQRNRGDRGPEEDDGGSKRKIRKRQGPFCKA
jgi:hypothetical protein